MAIKKNNVEYHTGYAAYKNGKTLDQCPYSRMGNNLTEDSRANRWTLGWNDAYTEAMGV